VINADLDTIRIPLKMLQSFVGHVRHSTPSARPVSWPTLLTLLVLNVSTIRRSRTTEDASFVTLRFQLVILAIHQPILYSVLFATQNITSIPKKNVVLVN